MYTVIGNDIYFDPLQPETWKAMENIKYILENNKSKGISKSTKKYFRFDSKRKIWVFSVRNEEFNGLHIQKFLFGINSVSNFKRFPVAIVLDGVKFKDKLVYIVLECICFYLIRYLKMNIKFYMSSIRSNIWTEGIKYSSLHSQSDQEFEWGFLLNSSDFHYRRIIGYDPSKTYTLSNEASRIFDFLNKAGVERRTAIFLTETLNEVIGNAKEHGRSDCLIDIDITDNIYLKRFETDGSEYYGLNVAVLNFSNIPFYHKLKYKLSFPENLKSNNKERYLKILEAKINHNKFFDEKYTENDFYTISSFQNKISGSVDKAATGGVGLTQLIKAIEENSESNYCYMLSENRAIYFLNEYLKFDKEMFIGFNEENDYFNFKPHIDVLGECPVFFPGAAYNLNFVIKRRNSDDGK